MSDHNAELDVSERAYHQAVLALKILDAAGTQIELIPSLRRQAHTFLASDSRSRRTFALHLLRFLYKTDRVSIGWFAKRRIRGLLQSDPSMSVRLAAFELLGVILTRTGSKSGVKESDYGEILPFRRKMLERSSTLGGYESSGMSATVDRPRPDEDARTALDRLIESVE